MAGTAACAIMATSTGRLVSGDERVATRATVTELGDVDRLAREGALLRIDCTILIGVSFWQLPTIVSRGGGLCHLPIPTRWVAVNHIKLGCGLSITINKNPANNFVSTLRCTCEVVFCNF